MASSPDVARSGSRLWKVVGASLIGTTIEWYDYFLYGTAAALVFGKVFFPNSDPLTGTLLSFLTYAIGFAARPLGALVFGHFGDRIGRKRLLVLSLLLMGGATTLIGCLPTYRQIGVAAPLLLTALRLVQGFALGGEWGGAVLLVSEHGDPRRRGFWASWPQGGAPAGNLLAAGVLSLLTTVQSDADFLAWGWRIRSCSPRCWSWSGCGSGCRWTSPRCSSRRWPRPRPVARRRSRRSWRCCATTGGTCWSRWAPGWPRTSRTT